MYQWEDIQGQTQKLSEGLNILSGLGAPWDPPTFMVRQGFCTSGSLNDFVGVKSKTSELHVSSSSFVFFNGGI